MATDDDRDRVDSPAGPTLYLESEALDPSEAFCTAVLDGTAGEYRVVQLTARQSFDSLRETFDAQLMEGHDPSEAAVIITTPHAAEDERPISTVGDETPLYGYLVDPRDLTGISVAFSRLLDEWGETEEPLRICLRDIESLLPYHDDDLVYRFLNTVLATLRETGADVHVHLRPDGVEPQTLQMLRSLFTQVVEPGETSPEAPAETKASEPGPRSVAPTDLWQLDADADAADNPTTMSDAEVDDFLGSEGYGVLSFDGAQPYAIPMSYGYDTDERVLYMHISSFEGSEKQTRLAGSDTVSLVVTRYERPDRWRSVIVDGSLTRLSPEAARERGALEVFATSKLASVDVFSRDPDEVDFDWYVLEPTAISGRQSVGSL